MIGEIWVLIFPLDESALAVNTHGGKSGDPAMTRKLWATGVFLAELRPTEDKELRREVTDPAEEPRDGGRERCPGWKKGSRTRCGAGSAP